MEIRGKFKSVNLFNQTMHIIIYPDEGLKKTAALQELLEGTEIIINIVVNRETGQDNIGGSG